MEIRVRYKRKLPLFVLLLPFGLFIGIATFVFSGDSDFMYLYSLNRNVSELLEAMSNSDDYDDAGDNEDYLPSFDNGTGTGTTAATNGSGLNLLLINNIQTECFIKDLLTCSVKSQNGEYYSSALHSSVASLLGAMAMEHGFYKQAPGIIPKTYFPWDDSANAPYYNKAYNGVPAASMKNEELTESDVFAMGTQGQIDSTSNNGLFGFKKTATIKKSLIYPEGKSRSGSGGDHYYYPDMCAQRDQTLINGLSGLGITSDEDLAIVNETSQTAVGAYSGLCNNRGPNGAKTMLFGIAYLKSLYNSPDTKVDTAMIDAGVKAKLLAQVTNDASSTLSTTCKGVDISGLDSSGGSAAFTQAILLLESGNGWYCTQSFVDVFTGNSSWANLFSTGKKNWNTMFPNDQISTAAELRERLEKYKCNSVSAAINQVTGVSVTAAELNNVYGIVDDNYENGDHHTEGSDWWFHSGFIYHVSNERSPVYKNKYSDNSEPFLLSSYELSGLAYYYASSTIGEIIYAKMLKYAGVDVDPTDPSTYMNQYSDEWTPSSSEEKEVYSTLQANGLDTSQLNENRAKVVIAAAGLVGITYHRCRGVSCDAGDYNCDGYCYNNMNAKPTHLDCSAFVWRAYADAGFDMKGFPTGTSGYPGSLPLEQITFDDLKPGDLIRRSGHVMMYLGKSSESVYTVEAHEHGTLSGYTTRSIRKVSDTSVYTYYRYPGIDG